MKLNLFILLMASILVFAGQAASAMSGNSEFGFLVLPELTAGVGTSGSQTSTPSRNMAYAEAALRLGVRYEWLAPVIEGTYRYLGQTTDSANVNGTNLAGSGYLLGAGLDFDFTKFSFIATYDFQGSFALSKTTSGGSTVNYTSPAGFRASLAIHMTQSWDLVFTYSNINYSNSKTDAGTTSLSGDLVNQTLYGVGAMYMF